MRISYAEIAKRIDRSSHNKITLENHSEDILIDLDIPYSRMIEEIDFEEIGYTAYLYTVVDTDEESGQPEGSGIIFYKDEPVAIFNTTLYGDINISAWFNRTQHQLFYITVRDAIMPVYREPLVIDISEVDNITDSTSTMKSG